MVIGDIWKISFTKNGMQIATHSYSQSVMWLVKLIHDAKRLVMSVSVRQTFRVMLPAYQAVRPEWIILNWEWHKLRLKGTEFFQKQMGVSSNTRLQSSISSVMRTTTYSTLSNAIQEWTSASRVKQSVQIRVYSLYDWMPVTERHTMC